MALRCNVVWRRRLVWDAIHEIDFDCCTFFFKSAHRTMCMASGTSTFDRSMPIVLINLKKNKCPQYTECHLMCRTPLQSGWRTARTHTHKNGTPNQWETQICDKFNWTPFVFDTKCSRFIFYDGRVKYIRSADQRERGEEEKKGLRNTNSSWEIEIERLFFLWKKEIREFSNRNNRHTPMHVCAQTHKILKL